MKRAISREIFIPKGATKVAHKFSDAVAYISTNRNGKPRATVFYGNQSRPVSDCWYRDEARREQHVTQLFAARKEQVDRVAARRGEAKAFRHSVKVGDIFYTSWGYDQTNVEFFQVTKLIGKKMCELREIACASHTVGSGSDRVVAQTDAFLTPRYDGDDRGLPIRRLIQEGYQGKPIIKICDVRRAYPWGERDPITGTVIGRSLHETSLGWGH